jgi:hypothetical protein
MEKITRENRAQVTKLWEEFIPARRDFFPQVQPTKNRKPRREISGFLNKIQPIVFLMADYGTRSFQSVGVAGAGGITQVT